MEYLKAKREDLDQIYQLVQETIQTIYPQYYPEIGRASWRERVLSHV